ncbi:Flotillin-2 [Polyplax serrata]|uniref:Flotillin-2 n=1 Tax=Polyplax serrata TaxID=468196 RepID=A0AAN8S049_POLSC
MFRNAIFTGTLTVEEVYKDRDQFAALVREVAAPDVGRMGIEILSFTIKDVYDDVQYLASLGKSQTAAVKRDADIGVAQANRDAGIREAECEKSAMDVKYNTDTKIEDNARMYKLQKANFDKEINTAVSFGSEVVSVDESGKAESALAYELQAAKIRQQIRNEEIQIDVVERRKEIQVEEQEVLRKERELSATVRLPAEAESYRVQMLAEGKRTQTVEIAKAEGERIRKVGGAEALAIGMVGKAEAERMRLKAKVYKDYKDAAIMSLIVDALPKIAAEVAAPLAKTEEIVILGGSDTTTGEITRLVGQIPPAVQALTGVDLSKKSNPELITVTTKVIETIKTTDNVRQQSQSSAQALGKAPSTAQTGTSVKVTEKKPSAIPTPRKSVEKKTVEIKASPRKIGSAESPRHGSSSENLKTVPTPKK